MTSDPTINDLSNPRNDHREHSGLPQPGTGSPPNGQSVSPFREFTERDHADLELVALPTAVRCGRQHVVAQLRQWGLEAYQDPCTLVVSELMTNAIGETGTLTVPAGYVELRRLQLARIRLRLRLTDTCLGIEVWDSSPKLPVPAVSDEEAEGGRGLYLVNACCTRWGTYPARWPRGGKVVYAVWDLPDIDGAAVIR
ncbi:MAG: putative anti-sigma regulatory factor, serine/threonine protein kinase [Gemmatimonadales bacterium]|nr:putative anti-sigma regulatory factor, serine/threonine protein kinase [Gemmatimonadales bacterium]